MWTYKERQRIKKHVWRATIGATILYVALTGCNNYKDVNLESHTEQRITVGAVQTRILERPRPLLAPSMVLAVRDGTLTTMGSKKERWMQDKVHEIYNSEHLPSSLESFVDKYWPSNMVPYIGNKRHSPKQYAINCFLDNYSHHKAEGKQEWSSRYASLKEVVVDVLETRQRAYE